MSGSTIHHMGGDGVTKQHPYYPLSISLPNYIPNTIPDIQILSYFGLICAIIVISSLLLYFLFKPQGTSKKMIDLGLFVWFVLCGFIHCFVEGYFVVFNQTLVADNSFMGQVWKHYSLADSRYLTSDSSVLVIEAITSFLWGPLSFFIAFCITKNSPQRHAVQLIVSIGQIYGDVLYYCTTFMEGCPHSRPEPQYFWGYFVSINAIWIVIPLIAVMQSCCAISTYAKRSHEYNSNNSAVGSMKKKL